MRRFANLFIVLGLFISGTASAQKPANCNPCPDVSSPILEGTLQIAILEVFDAGQRSKTLSVLSGSVDHPGSFPLSMWPLEMTNDEYTALVQNGGETSTAFTYEIGMPPERKPTESSKRTEIGMPTDSTEISIPTPFKTTNPHRHNAVLTRFNVNGSVKVVLDLGTEPTGRYFQAQLTKDDLINMVAAVKNPNKNRNKTWDLNPMPEPEAFTIFLPAPKPKERSETVTISDTTIVCKRGCYLVNDPNCPGRRVWIHGSAPYREISTHTEQQPLPPETVVQIDPFGPLNPKDVSKLCALIETEKRANDLTERRLCLTFIPKDIEPFEAGCP